MGGEFLLVIDLNACFLFRPIREVLAFLYRPAENPLACSGLFIRQSTAFEAVLDPLLSGHFIVMPNQGFCKNEPPIVGIYTCPSIFAWRFTPSPPRTPIFSTGLNKSLSLSPGFGPFLFFSAERIHTAFFG